MCLREAKSLDLDLHVGENRHCNTSWAAWTRSTNSLSMGPQRECNSLVPELQGKTHLTGSDIPQLLNTREIKAAAGAALELTQVLSIMSLYRCFCAGASCPHSHWVNSTASSSKVIRSWNRTHSCYLEDQSHGLGKGVNRHLRGTSVAPWCAQRDPQTFQLPIAQAALGLFSKYFKLLQGLYHLYYSVSYMVPTSMPVDIKKHNQCWESST